MRASVQHTCAPACMFVCVCAFNKNGPAQSSLEGLLIGLLASNPPPFQIHGRNVRLLSIKSESN